MNECSEIPDQTLGANIEWTVRLVIADGQFNLLQYVYGIYGLTYTLYHSLSTYWEQPPYVIIWIHIEIPEVNLLACK